MVAHTTQETTTTSNANFFLDAEAAKKMIESLSGAVAPKFEKGAQGSVSVLSALHDDIAFQVEILQALRTFLQMELDHEKKDEFYVAFPPAFDVAMYNAVRSSPDGGFFILSEGVRAAIHLFYYRLRQINSELDARRSLGAAMMGNAIIRIRMSDANMIQHIDACLSLHKAGKINF